MKNIKKLQCYLLYIAISTTILIGCKKEKIDSITSDPIHGISNPSYPILGIWMINTEQYLDIRNNDTIVNRITDDGRYFEFKEDSILIIYWTYPNSFDESIWYKKGTDSLYVYFDGPNSDIVYKYKFKQINSSKMIWEEIINEWEDEVQKSIYEVIKI